MGEAPLRLDDGYLSKLAKRIDEPGILGRLTLWIRLSTGAVPGFEFDCDIQVSGYTIDFYCRKIKLGVEVVSDGAREGEAARSKRSHLESCGVILLTFTEHELREYIEDVIEHIQILAGAFSRMAEAQ